MKITRRIVTTLLVLLITVAPAFGQRHRRHKYYRNSSGARVHSPMLSRRAPHGASARCADGTYTFSRNHRGTCSHHGGVAQWLR